MTQKTTGNSAAANNASSVVDDTTLAAVVYPVWSAGIENFNSLFTSSTGLNYNPSTAALTAVTFIGALTGNASTATTATTVTTNANLTGDITSVGNATSLAIVNTDIGAFTNANITVNAKGLITAAASGSSGTGTVSSVTFTGDGVVLSSTPSSAVTTTGTLTAAIKNQTANTVLAGPNSGIPAAPTFRALTTSDISLTPVGTLLYSNTSVPGGNTVANTTTPTSFSSGYTVPANGLVTGTVLRVKAYGLYSTALIAPTIKADLLFGGAAILTTGVITAVAGVTNAGWWAEGYLIVDTTGATGTLESQGYGEFATAATTGLSVNLTNTGTATIDTTASNAIAIRITWGTADASNSITLRQLTVENMTTTAGPVGSVSNSDGTLTIGPTSGNVVASLALSHANTWAGQQTFVAPILGTPASGTLTNCTGLPVAGGGTGAATFTDGGVLIGNATGAIQVTSAGTSGQILTSNGAGVDPTFQTGGVTIGKVVALTRDLFI